MLTGDDDRNPVVKMASLAAPVVGQVTSRPLGGHNGGGPVTEGSWSLVSGKPKWQWR